MVSICNYYENVKKGIDKIQNHTYYCIIKLIQQYKIAERRCCKMTVCYMKIDGLAAGVINGVSYIEQKSK